MGGTYFTLIKTCVVCQLNLLRPHTQRSAERHGLEEIRASIFFSRLEVTLNSGSRGEKGAASVATSPPYSGPLLCVLRGGMVLLSFFLSYYFFLPSPSLPLCLISRCEEMRITALKARRGGAASRRVAALEKRSVLANLTRINDTLGWRGKKKKARTSIGGAPHSPPTTTTPCVHAPR